MAKEETDALTVMALIFANLEDIRIIQVVELMGKEN
jgi:hypothetical protein